MRSNKAYKLLTIMLATTLSPMVFANSQKTIEFHVYSHVDYPLRFFQENDHKHNWDNFGGLDISGRVIPPYGSGMIEAQDTSSAWGSDINKDPIGLELHYQGDHGHQLEKKVYFVLNNPSASTNTYVDIGANWQTQTACEFLDVDVTRSPSFAGVQPRCDNLISTVVNSGINRHSFDINVYADHIVVGSRIGPNVDTNDISRLNLTSAASYKISEILTPDPVAVIIK